MCVNKLAVDVTAQLNNQLHLEAKEVIASLLAVDSSPVVVYALPIDWLAAQTPA